MGFTGKQIFSDLSVKDGIAIADKQTLGGNMIVKAKNLDEAIGIAKGCPILKMGGSVEVRDIIPMES